MKPEDKTYLTLYNNITYAMERFEVAQKELIEGMLLLKGSQAVVDEIRRKTEVEKTIEE